MKKVSFPFDVYQGQDSRIVNVINDSQLAPSAVNPFVAEEITRNKFLQYLLLEKSPVRHILPSTTLVGLGYANDKELEELTEAHDSFVQKPLLGKCGQGVKFVGEKEVQRFKHLNGEVYNPPFLPRIRDIYFGQTPPTYFEGLVDEGDFSFEMAMGIVQPFIDSRREIEGQDSYSSIRAIVCNGTFVDAYERYSPEKRVNLSQGAKARAYEADGLAEFCEYVVGHYDQKCETLNPNTFRQQLYSSFLDERGRRSYQATIIVAMVEAVIGSIAFSVKK